MSNAWAFTRRELATSGQFDVVQAGGGRRLELVGARNRRARPSSSKGAIVLDWLVVLDLENVPTELVSPTGGQHLPSEFGRYEGVASQDIPALVGSNFLALLIAPHRI